MKKGKDGFYYRFVKRILDLAVSVVALIVLLPVWLVLSLLVFIKLGSPVLYTARRIGTNGKLFKLYKFRSMTNECDENGNLLSSKLRTPRFGKILRSTSLDELPELFINVIKGDMSLIGPRPLSEKTLPYYTKEEMHRHDVRPGITGLAQINGRNFLDWQQRFALDLKYVNEVSFKLDMQILFKTFMKVIKREDVIDASKGIEINFPDYRREQWDKGLVEKNGRE